MPLPVGDRLGPYEILAPIGAGGMGEVYRARDTKLKREVALKVLPETFARDPGRLARFQREAEVLASLNHPNIAAIYGVEENALVMELVEGETLPRSVPVDTALNYAKQIADALEAAHEKGITHRDLKPSNVMVTREGVVKVLDFGLALQNRDHVGAEDSTVTMSPTRAGVIMGTVAYMSSEQARGQAVDRRADIWAFGVVLYEMLTGKRAFAGETVSDVLAAVLKEQPELERVPPRARRLVKCCLEKDPRQRLQSIGDWRLALDDVPEPAPAPSRSRFSGAGLAAVAMLAVVVALALWAPWRTLPEARVLTTTIPPPEGAAFDFGFTRNAPILSPDGRQLVFTARSADGKIQLWARALNSGTAQPLAGTENPRFPFWSPDSKSIGFFASGKLKTMDVTGGPAVTIADAPVGDGGSWSPDGVIVFAPNESSPLERVPASGGAPSPATTLGGRDDFSHRFPWFLPDGRHFLFQSRQQDGNGISIRVASLDSREAKRIARASSSAIYADGRLLFLRERALMAQPFDAKRLVLAGDAVPVAEQVGQVPGDRVGLFSAASTGLLAYQSGPGAGPERLTWFDRNGKPASNLGSDTGDLGGLEFSPDQRSLAVSVRGVTDPQDLWIYDVARGLRTRFTFDPATDSDAVWSPDGRSVAFRSNRKGHSDIYRKSSDGTGAEELLYADNLEKFPVSWSPDGKFLLYFATGPKAADDIWVLPLTPAQGAAPKPFLFLQTASSEGRPRFSPDGRWVAYHSNESTQNEIYVAPFPGPGGKRQISTSGGVFPRWRRDGKEIFYVGADDRLMAAEVNFKGNTIEVGQVRSLGIPVLRNASAAGGYRYEVSGDGQRFLVTALSEPSGAPPLTLVQNWAAGLKK